MSKNTVLEEVNNLSEKLSNSFNVRFDDSIKFNDIIKIQKSDDYIDTLKKELESYKKNFEKDAFYLFYSGFNLKEDVEKNCKSVQKISELLIDGVNDEKNKYYNEAKDKMKKLLKKYIDNKFILGEIYTSAFKFNEIGLKKVKVLNLAISEELLNGIFIAGHDHNMKDTKLKNYLKELKISLLKIAPLLIASNFRITDKNDKFLI